MSRYVADGFMFALGMMLAFIVVVLILAIIVYLFFKTGKAQDMAVGAFKNIIGY